jgi:cell division inhibitor SepF
MAGMLEKMKSWLFAEEDPEEVLEPENGQRRELRRRKRSSFISLHAPREGEIFIRKPKSQEDGPFCVDCLRDDRPVVVNLKGLEQHEARRVFDFLKGAIYALDGQMEEAGESIFVLTPRGVEISAEIDSATASDQIDFWQDT